jgi:putative transcriptional regulator
MKEKFMEKIAGEITLSESPGRTIRKWREAFSISQQDLAEHLEISPSVISDYESGRRKSPGVISIKRIVQAFLELDEQTGGKVIKQFTLGMNNEAILSMRDFPVPITADEFNKIIDGESVTGQGIGNEVHGYTIIDSVRAIISMDSSDYLKIYGLSSQRALIFTNVRYGRSPMVAIRAHPLTPALIVYHKPDKIDSLAIKLAELENVSLVVTKMELDELIGTLEKL